MEIFKLTSKSLLFILLSILILFTYTSSLSQNLEGKWIIAEQSNKYSILNAHVMEFTKDSLTNYEFDKRFSATPYHITGHRINVDTASIGVFSMVHKDRFRLASERINDSIDFVRLKPTKTKLSATQIKDISYAIDYQGRILSMNFDETQENRNPDTRLEKIDSTYFLSLYRHGERLGSTPIEQITTDKIILYGIPEKPYRLSGKAVK